jgi:hypothetical protein
MHRWLPASNACFAAGCRRCPTATGDQGQRVTQSAAPPSLSMQGGGKLLPRTRIATTSDRGDLDTSDAAAAYELAYREGVRALSEQQIVTDSMANDPQPGGSQPTPSPKPEPHPPKPDESRDSRRLERRALTSPTLCARKSAALRGHASARPRSRARANRGMVYQRSTAAH